MKDTLNQKDQKISGLELDKQQVITDKDKEIAGLKVDHYQAITQKVEEIDILKGVQLLLTNEKAALQNEIADKDLEISDLNFSKSFQQLCLFANQEEISKIKLD